MTIAIAIACAVVAIGLIIGGVHRHTNRWEPAIFPYECFPCRARFATAKLLVAHMHGNHDVDFDDHEVTVIRGYTLGGDK